MSIFYCKKCKDKFPRDADVLEIDDKLSYCCAECGLNIVGNSAYMLPQKTNMTCAFCKKEFPIGNAFACERCFDCVACSAECWSKISAFHDGVCDVNDSISQELEITAYCDCDGKEINQCYTDTAVGSKTSHSSSHSHRHPQVSSQKAKTILSHGEVRGHPLTKSQRGLFGCMAGGRCK